MGKSITTSKSIDQNVFQFFYISCVVWGILPLTCLFAGWLAYTLPVLTIMPLLLYPLPPSFSTTKDCLRQPFNSKAIPNVVFTLSGSRGTSPLAAFWFCLFSCVCLYQCIRFYFICIIHYNPLYMYVYIHTYIYTHTHTKLLQLCLTLCDPMDCI